MAPKWSSSDKGKLTLTRRLRSLLELIWRVLHVNLRFASALLSLVVLGWKRSQPMQTSSGRSRAASFSILHRTSPSQHSAFCSGLLAANGHGCETLPGLGSQLPLYIPLISRKSQRAKIQVTWILQNIICMMARWRWRVRPLAYDLIW